VPGAGNPQTLNRYSFVLGNPLKYTDPSGHRVTDGCGQDGGRDPEAEAAQGNYFRARQYYLACQNGSGSNCPDSVGVDAFVAGGLVAVGAAPTALAAGAEVVDTIAAAASTYCALSDACRNLLQWFNGTAAESAAQDNLPGDTSVDYTTIQPYIKQAIDNGTSRVLNVNADGDPILEYVATINGQQVVVHGIELANGIFRMSDAWIKTK
jgi:hypothetical protein